MVGDEDGESKQETVRVGKLLGKLIECTCTTNPFGKGWKN